MSPIAVQARHVIDCTSAGLPPSCGIVTDYRTYTAYCGYICKHYKSSVCFVSLLLFVVPLSRFQCPTPSSLSFFFFFCKRPFRVLSRALGIALLLPRPDAVGLSFDTTRRAAAAAAAVRLDIVVTRDCPREKTCPIKIQPRLRSGCSCRGTTNIEIRSNADHSNFTTVGENRG